MNPSESKHLYKAWIGNVEAYVFEGDDGFYVFTKMKRKNPHGIFNFINKLETESHAREIALQSLIQSAGGMA